jgi:hypothetical protein
VNRPAIFLRMLCVIWGVALATSLAQVTLCEIRAGKGQQCGQEWQLALTTPLGLGQTLFSLFQDPPGP